MMGRISYRKGRKMVEQEAKTAGPEGLAAGWAG
jgi:hypothetical protein